MLESHLPFKVCDPIHQAIYFNELEKEVIDSSCFQRLRSISQMGNCYLLYPSARHSRFEHSLGVMFLASKIFDVLTKHVDPHFLPENLSYWKQILRLAALCHDLGHLPFSHTAEKALLGSLGHEKMTAKIIDSKPLSSMIQKLGSQAVFDVLKVALDPKAFACCYPNYTLTPFESILSKIITEDNFGADRIDYLIRDSYFTGVSYGLFDHIYLIDALRILPTLDQKQHTLGVVVSGMQAVESLWTARYMMYNRVYQHPKAKIYSYHLEQFMKLLFQEKLQNISIETYLEYSDRTVLDAIEKSSHFHAQVLKKQLSPYVEIGLSKKEAFLLEDIDFLNHFKGSIWIDKNSTKGEPRLFPVLCDRDRIVGSDEISLFLQSIPSKGYEKRLFAQAEKKEEIYAYFQRKQLAKS